MGGVKNFVIDQLSIKDFNKIEGKGENSKDSFSVEGRLDYK